MSDTEEGDHLATLTRIKATMAEVRQAWLEAVTEDETCGSDGPFHAFLIGYLKARKRYDVDRMELRVEFRDKPTAPSEE